MRSVIIAIVLLSICTAACAVGKVTIDPNAGSSKAADEQKPDARLAQKITYEAAHKPLKTVIDDLARMSGVTMSAGYSKQDWQVRDRKMNIFVKDLPLAELMDSIARVMKFRWSRSDRTPPTYRLVQDRKLLGKMEAEYSRKQDEMHAEVVARRKYTGDTILKVAAMSDAEIDALRDKNPYLYWTGKTGFARFTQAMFNDVPGLREMWERADTNLGPPMSALSPATQQLYLDVVKANYPYRLWDSKAVAPELALSDLKANFGFENIPRPMTIADRQQLRSYGGIGGGSKKGFLHLGTYGYPDDPGMQARAAARVRVAEDGADSGDAIREELVKASARMEKTEADWEPYFCVEPVVEHPDEPELHRKAKLKMEDPKPPEVEGDLMDTSRQNFALAQKAIGEAFDLDIVSDSFALSRANAAFAKDEERELLSALDAIAEPYFCNWERHGNTIEFRHRDWFKRRTSQIPDEWITRWRDSFKKRGTMSLDEYAQVCALEYDQVEENLLTDPVLHQVTSLEDWNMFNIQSMLRLYLRLDNNQRAMLASPGGLNLGSLSPDQWPLAEAAFGHGYGFSWNADRLLDLRSGPSFLSMERVDVPGQPIRYNFIATKDGLQPLKRHVTLPVYQMGAKVSEYKS